MGPPKSRIRSGWGWALVCATACGARTEGQLATDDRPSVTPIGTSTPDRTTTTGGGPIQDSASGGARAQPQPIRCGNRRLEGGELCDGNALGGETCETATLGAMPLGKLRCTSSCAFDTSGCGTGALVGSGATSNMGSGGTVGGGGMVGGVGVGGFSAGGFGGMPNPFFDGGSDGSDASMIGDAADD